MFNFVHTCVIPYKHVYDTLMTCYVAYVGVPFKYLHNPTEFFPLDRSIFIALFKFRGALFVFFDRFLRD